jgi:hypothetical protein
LRSASPEHAAEMGKGTEGRPEGIEQGVSKMEGMVFQGVDEG